jgi:hypothetical protein
MTTRSPLTFSALAYLWLWLIASILVPATASAQIQTFTDRAAWEAAVAAAGSSAQFYDFTGLGLVSPDTTGVNRVDQLDTDYAGRFRIVIDQLASSPFSNPGVDIFPDAGCSLGTGDCNVFTFNVLDPTSTLVGPKVNKLVMPMPIVAFGGNFIQTGVTAPTGTVTGQVTLGFGTHSVVVNNYLDGSGNGFFGFVAEVPATTIEFTFAKSGTIQNDIFQIYNPAFAEGPPGPPPAYGVVARAARRGEFGNETDILGGDVGVGSITRWVASTDGSDASRAVLGGVCALPGQVTKECMRAGAFSASYLGAARSIAFLSFRYGGATAQSGRVNAVLDGQFREAPFNLPNGFLTVGGSVRLLEPSAFSQRLADAGMPAGEFLLGGYTVGDGTDIEERFRQTRIQLSASLLSSGEEFLRNNTTPSDTPVTIPVRTGSVIFQPGATYTVMLDVATSSLAQIFGGATGYGRADFLTTLAPAPVFFSDDAGNPIAGFEPVGDLPEPPPAAAALALGPATATGSLDLEHSVIATVTDASGNPVPDIPVSFEIMAGPNTGVGTVAPTDALGQAAFTYSGTGGLGTDFIQAAIGALSSNTVQKTWTPPGALDHIAITPGSATVAAGTSQAFTVEAFDRFTYSRGDVTADAVLSISPNGSCAAGSCTASAPGPYTVSATYQGKTATASLTVTGTTTYSFTGFFSPIDNLPVLNTTKAGSSLPIKFSLQGNQGLDIVATGYPVSQQVACAGGALEDQVEQVASPGASGLQYDAQSDVYTYVWKSEKSWVGKCRQLVVKLKDGSEHTAMFKFK